LIENNIITHQVKYGKIVSVIENDFP
jgi:hypothetical protein